MLLTFKMRNGNGEHQDPCQKTYLLFPNISLPLTSLPVDCKHSPFQATSLQKPWWTVNCNWVCYVLWRETVSTVHGSKKNLGGTRYLPSKWETEAEHIKILLKRLILLFPNISLPLTSLPVNCKHSPFQATSLQNHGELLTAIESVISRSLCVFLQVIFDSCLVKWYMCR